MRKSKQGRDELNTKIQSCLHIFLNKKSKEYTNEELELILEMLGKLKYFSEREKLIDRKTMINIAKCMKTKFYEKGKNIIRFLEESKRFYIILMGEVEVFIPDSIKKDCLTSINTLTIGQSFGEIAILKNKPRSATINALTNCYLAEIEQKDYIENFNTLENERMKNLVSFMKKYAFFKNTEKIYIERFYFIKERKIFKKDEIVYKEGDKVDGIYFVVDGELVVSFQLYSYFFII